MSLDLGALIAHATIETTAFDRGTARIMRVLSTFGTEADRASSGVRVLDDSLIAAGGAADKASTAIGRATQATRAQGAAAERTAAQDKQQAAAQAQVNRVLAQYAAEGPRVQQAALRVAAAQERVNQLQESGVATTRQLASAQATLIGAQRSLTAAQQAGAVAGGRFRTSMAGTLKMARDLGIIFGGIAIAKKAIEFVGAGKDLTDALNSVQAAAQATDEEMKAVRAQAIGLGKDLTVPRATAVDAANAIDDLVRSGMTLPRAMAAARSALLLASVAQEDTAFSARVLGDALDEFQLPAEQAAHVANLLGAAATSTAGGLDTVFNAMKYAGSRARAADIPMNDLLASIVDLSKAGLQGTTIGTGLAMMITRLASKSEPTVKALEDLGIQAWDAQGRFKGLPFVIDAVSQAQKRFGPNSQRFLSDLNDAFGARAANVMAAFAGKGIEGVDRFAARLNSFNLQDAANKMNRGLSAAAAQIKKEFTAAGIEIYDKFEPAVVSAAMWLGTKLPHAVSTLAHILGPTAHTLGDEFGGALHIVGSGLHVLVGLLGNAAHFLEQNKTLVTAVVTAWLTLRVAVGIVRGLTSLIETMRIKAMYAGDGIKSAFTGVNMALTGAGVVLGALIYQWQTNKQEAAAMAAEAKANIEGLTAAIEQDSGALGDNTVAWIKHKLITDGVFDRANGLGLSFQEITDAVLGNGDALAHVNQLWAHWQQLQAAGLSTIGAKNVAALNEIRALAGETQTASRHNQQYAESTKKAAGATDIWGGSIDFWTRTAHKAAATTDIWGGALGRAAGATNKDTTAIQRNVASLHQQLAAIERLIQTQLSQAQSQDQFEEAVRGVTSQLKGSHDQLDRNSKAGLANRDAFLSAVSAALSLKDAQDKAGGSVAAHTRKLADNIAELRQAAVAAGADKGEVDKLLGSLNAMPAHIRSQIDLSTTRAEIALGTFRQKLYDTVNQNYTAVLTVVENDIRHGNTAAGRASGGGLPEGVSAVGERGPELAIKRGSHVQILSNAASKAYLATTGMRAPGFAGGTTPTPSELRQQARDELRSGRHLVGGYRSLGRLLADMTSTRSDFASVFGSIYSALRDAGATHQFVTGLKRQDDAILAAVTRRAKAAKRLANANQDLHDAQHKLKTDRRSFGGAVVGSFDITTAGQNANGRVTRGGILASSAQAVTRARAFVQGMKKLIGMHVFPARYLRSLLAEGPSALPEVQALAGMPRADIVKLAQENRQLNKLGNQIGGLGATRLDQHGIDVAQRQVNHWERIERERDRKLEKLTHEQTVAIVEALKSLHLIGKLGLTAGQLALIVDTGHNQNAKANRTANR